MNNWIAVVLLVCACCTQQGCASIGSKQVSVACGVITTGVLISYHSPWAIVPLIFTIGEATNKAGTDSGSAALTCGGTAMSVF